MGIDNWKIFNYLKNFLTTRKSKALQFSNRKTYENENEKIIGFKKKWRRNYFSLLIVVVFLAVVSCFLNAIQCRHAILCCVTTMNNKDD